MDDIIKPPHFNGIRNSRMDLNEVYFWTDTIKDWNPLLVHDQFKMIIIESLRNLVQREKIVVYGFVIMPNHIHIVWEMISMNGKEMPHASFNKFTSHQFLKHLTATDATLLVDYKEPKFPERLHRFWQRDPLAVLIYSKEMVEQKLEYIHTNPLQGQWNLVDMPEKYKWSSALFYEKGIDEFGFLTDYQDKF